MVQQISLVQHPSNGELGTSRDTDVLGPSKPSTSKTISHLSSSYSEVTPMALPVGDLNAPEVSQQLLTSRVSLSGESDYDEEDWLSNTQELVCKGELQPRDFVSWAAHRATQSSLSSYKPAITSLLPMFVENAHSLAMIAHSIPVIKSAVQHVNPSHTPVIALDQP